MLISEVQQCDITSWYEDFKRLTFPTSFVLLPEEVLRYLREDSTLILPKECDAEGYFDNNDNSDSECELEDEGSQEGERPSFPEFSQRLKDVLGEGIKKNGAFIKLNWSSPKDANWVLASGLKVSTLTDIYLLLKSSHFLHHDLSNPFKDCSESTIEEQKSTTESTGYVLAIRDWVSINPGHEFRCFVRGKTLVGVSQRDHTSFYNYILREEDVIRMNIKQFFHQYLQDKFPLNNYVF
uniref:Cell division cycle protein 123 homolog n=1 Tax=Caligus clemensi TaxID=344056 RepID=C1C2Q3_CALCM|nr:Cell division cycle protein 123 homolog [Caligus clemensi]